MKRMPWETLLSCEAMVRDTTSFSLGLLSVRNFQDLADSNGVGNLARRVIKQRGKRYAMRLARKALRRRRLLNAYNLAD